MIKMTIWGRSSLFYFVFLLFSLQCFGQKAILSGLTIKDFANECDYIFASEFGRGCAKPLDVRIEELKALSLAQIFNPSEKMTLEFLYSKNSMEDLKTDLVAWINIFGTQQKGLGITPKARVILSQLSFSKICRLSEPRFYVDERHQKTYYQVQCLLN